MRHLINVLATIALFTANQAQAEDSPRPPTTSHPETYFVVVGATEYANAPGLTGTDGAGEDCTEIAHYLKDELSYPANRVLSMCGTQLVRGGFVARLNAFVTQGIPSGSTIVMIWIGHGGTDPKTQEKILGFVNNSFSLWVRAGSGDRNNGYNTDGMNPSLLNDMLRWNIPVDANIVYLTDVARGGHYLASGEKILLEGPDASDFVEFDRVYALSPSPGPIATGLTRKVIMKCLDPKLTSDGIMNTATFSGCYKDAMGEAGIAPVSSGDWGAAQPLITFPSFVPQSPPPALPTLPPEAVAKKKPPVVKVALVAAGGATAITGGIGAYIAYADGMRIRADAETGVYTADERGQILDAYNHDHLKYATWLSVGAVGLGVAGIGVIIPRGEVPPPPVSMTFGLGTVTVGSSF